MGAYEFVTAQRGANIREAFQDARSEAQWEHGHGGYSGTIAEKHDYEVIQHTPLGVEKAIDLAYRLIQENDERVRDKWGPAAAIPVFYPTREVTVEGFDYTPSRVGYGIEDTNLTEAVTALLRKKRLIRRGEKVEGVDVGRYTQTQPKYGYSWGHSPDVRKDCMAKVTLRKAKSSLKNVGEQEGWVFFGFASS